MRHGQKSDTPGVNNGYWQGFTEHRIEALESDVKEVRSDVKQVLSKLDQALSKWESLPCHKIGTPGEAGCPAPTFILPGGELTRDSPQAVPTSINSILEGWKGRVTFVVSVGIVTAIAVSSFIFVMSSNDKFAAIMQISDMVRPRQETNPEPPSNSGK